MGGKLIQHYGFEEKRLNKRDFSVLEEHIKSVFNSEYVSGKRHETILYFREKESFGDLDYLVEGIDGFNYIEFIKKHFNPTFVEKNDRVYSFDYNGFQVDLIVAATHQFDFTKTYFCYNDSVGNLAGRIANKLGLKLGHEGLYYILREDTFTGNPDHQANRLSEILLTLDPREAWTFLGFDFDKVERGFDTLQQSYDFILEGKYFDPDIFDYENLNHINRTRNRKRVNYATFVDLLENNKEKYRKFTFSYNKREYFKLISDAFPHLNVEIEKLKVEYFLEKEDSLKFNGGLVMKWTGLKEGKDLGFLISNFKKQFKETNLNFKDFVRNNSYEEIQEKFMKFYHQNSL